MMPETALDMFRGNFPFPPNFIFFYCVGVPPSPPRHLGRSPFLDRHFKSRINNDF
jgi:hypothetical protein